MAEHKLEISGLSCGSCERIIERLAEKSGMKVKEIDGNTGRVVVDVPDASGGRQGGEAKGECARCPHGPHNGSGHTGTTGRPETGFQGPQ